MAYVLEITHARIAPAMPLQPKQIYFQIYSNHIAKQLWAHLAYRAAVTTIAMAATG
jgi:hypothetical protein